VPHRAPVVVEQSRHADATDCASVRAPGRRRPDRRAQFCSRRALYAALRAAPQHLPAAHRRELHAGAADVDAQAVVMVRWGRTIRGRRAGLINFIGVPLVSEDGKNPSGRAK
jgi:hypothetical protein